jgi:hypothetical protein
MELPAALPVRGAAGRPSGASYQEMKIMPPVRSTGPVSGTGVSAPVFMLVLAM